MCKMCVFSNCCLISESLHQLFFGVQPRGNYQRILVLVRALQHEKSRLDPQIKFSRGFARLLPFSWSKAADYYSTTNIFLGQPCIVPNSKFSGGPLPRSADFLLLGEAKADDYLRLKLRTL